jgi:hypothetical protein
MMVEYQGTWENQTVLGRGGKPVRRAIIASDAKDAKC